MAPSPSRTFLCPEHRSEGRNEHARACALPPIRSLLVLCRRKFQECHPPFPVVTSERQKPQQKLKHGEKDNYQQNIQLQVYRAQKPNLFISLLRDRSTEPGMGSRG